MSFRSIIFIVLAAIQGAVASKSCVAIFPLKNESSSELYEWIGPGIAETFSRKLHMLEGFRVWDPVFLFQTDPTGGSMRSDSLMKIHRNRWQWDVVIGGRYSVAADSLLVDFSLLWATGREEPLRIAISMGDRVVDFFPMCNKALFKILAVIQYKLSSGDSLALLRGTHGDAAAYRTFAAGYGYEMRGNQNAALTAYARAEEIDPRCASAECRMGMVYRKSNDFELAGAAFERACAEGGDDPDIVAEAADFMAENEASSRAFKFMDNHRALLEKTSSGLKAMGTMYLAAGEYQRALALLTQAVAFGPTDLDVDFTLGKAYSAAGDLTRASEIFNRLIQFRPDYLRYYASLGGAYRKAGRLMESVMVLESAHKIDPDNTTILIDLAHTDIMLGLYEKAGQLLYRAREIGPLPGDVAVNLGVVYWYQGKKDEAVMCFREAARTVTTRQSALNNEGTMLFLRGSIGKAINAYTKADETGHKNETVLYNLATAYLKKRDLKKAARYFDEMLQLVPDRIEVLVQQASIAMTLRRYDAAEGYYHKIIELLPDHEAAVRGVVSLLTSEKRYEEAAQPVEDFLNRQPSNREFMTLLASLYEKMGWYEVALQKYQAIVRTFPNDSAGMVGIGVTMYDMVRYKDAKNYDNAVLALKQADERAANNPEPDMYIGDIYADYQAYHDLAVEYWKKALAKAADAHTRKLLERKIAGKK